MTDERWKQLSESDFLPLTKSELEEGWHFCWEFDGLLVGPGMGELNCCNCLPSSHPVYLTAPKEDYEPLDLDGGLG